MFKCSYYLTLNDFELLGVHIGEHFNNENIHFVKNVQIRSFSWAAFFLYLVKIQENNDQKKLRTCTLFTQWSLLFFQVHLQRQVYHISYFHSLRKGQLKMLGTFMWCPVGLPTWVLQNTMLIKIIGKSDKIYWQLRQWKLKPQKITWIQGFQYPEKCIKT